MDHIADFVAAILNRHIIRDITNLVLEYVAPADVCYLKCIDSYLLNVDGVFYLIPASTSTVISFASGHFTILNKTRYSYILDAFALYDSTDLICHICGGHAVGALYDTEHGLEIAVCRLCWQFPGSFAWIGSPTRAVCDAFRFDTQKSLYGNVRDIFDACNPTRDTAFIESGCPAGRTIATGEYGNQCRCYMSRDP